MENGDVLLTVAEVATAFAGFATLAAVFTGRDKREAEAKVAVRFQTLLIYALATIGFCFVPFVPVWYGYPADVSWSVSAWFLASGIACINLWMIRRNRAGIAMVSSPLLIPWVLAAWSPVLIAGLGLAGIGTTPANYLVALLATLFLSAGAFVRVIASLTSISSRNEAGISRQE